MDGFSSASKLLINFPRAFFCLRLRTGKFWISRLTIWQTTRPKWLWIYAAQNFLIAICIVKFAVRVQFSDCRVWTEKGRLLTREEIIPSRKEKPFLSLLIMLFFPLFHPGSNFRFLHAVPISLPFRTRTWFYFSWHPSFFSLLAHFLIPQVISAKKKGHHRQHK